MTKSEIAIIHHVTADGLPRLRFCAIYIYIYIRLTELQEIRMAEIGYRSGKQDSFYTRKIRAR
jgi:hypothetical protein